MIPKVTRSRGKLFSYLNDFEDGARVFVMSGETYPELFEMAHADIVQKAPKGWKTNKTGNRQYLWFPPDALDEDDLKAIDDWKDRFGHYVLIGLNRNIQDHFSDELDFCMALDYNYDPSAEKRTLYGEAEYQLKYQHSRPHLSALQGALAAAFADLPIPAGETVVITHVPASPDKCNVPRKLARAVAKDVAVDYVDAKLLCDKSAMKGLTVAQKIPEWAKIYACAECVELDGDVGGRTVVVIDDLYQSGATMWCFAKYLKEQRAKYVLGLPCVKSLRDTDNQ